MSLIKGNNVINTVIKVNKERTSEDNELINSFTSSFDESYGANCTRLPEGITTIIDYAFYGLKNLPLTELPESITYIGESAFERCSNLALTKLPNGITKIPPKCFYYNNKLALSNLPEGITTIDRSAFEYCKNITIKELPKGLTQLNSYAFRCASNIEISEIPEGVTKLWPDFIRECDKINRLRIKGDITEISYDAFNLVRNLSVISLPNITSVPVLGDATRVFSSTPISKGEGIIYLPDKLVEEAKIATNWSNYADQIHGDNLTSLELHCVDIRNVINTYVDRKIDIYITYNNGFIMPCHKEQEEYILIVNGNAIADGNSIILTDNAQVGDIITITAVSTYDANITSTIELEVIYREPVVLINLNNGQWIDSGMITDNGNPIYKSDVGSYHIDNGISIATITVQDVKNLKFYIRSYAESGYDYTEAFPIDTNAVRGKGLFTTKNKQSITNYVECIYELDCQPHTIQIMYSKDTGGNRSDDRGYFYIGEYS